MTGDRKTGFRQHAGKEVAQFAPNFTVYVLPPDVVCLYSEDRKYFLHGEVYCAIATIIGKGGKNISQQDALSHVFGYTVINDITARDLQSRHKQFFKGKSLDGSCPMGPWIVTADEIQDPHNLPLRLRVNGETKQDANTSGMIFSIPVIIETLSKGITLEPGDIIATVTPSGVGFSRTPPEFLKPGDVVEAEVEGIGSIKNSITGVQK